MTESDKKNEEMTLCRDLEIAIEEICCIQEEAMAIGGRILELNSVQQRNRLSVDRSKLMSNGKNTSMVGFDDDLIKIKDWVTSSSSKLEVISIVGMGGIGKTTLARNVFDDPLIVYQFDVRSWVTVCQEYEVREILAGLLRPSTSQLSTESEEKLAERLYKSLKGRRYLIAMDDLWETKEWDDVKRLFPDDNNGSRIILTTRLTDVGVYAASGNHVLNLSFLSSSDSWNLLCKKVFGEESCPEYLVGIGQEIARHCRGLPLSLVVVGGLLSMDQTVGYWETIASSINSLLATDCGQCSMILSLSYDHLPAHLKPCFRYVRIGRCYLSNPPCSSAECGNSIALTNLHTLKIITNFRFTDEIIKQLPSLKKLEVYYDEEVKDWPHYHLSNIVCLDGLEALQITSRSKIDFPENFKFPSSLKKLNLSGCQILGKNRQW